MAKNREKSKNLTLSIKRQYFDAILSGEKTLEERQIWPDSVGAYLRDAGRRYANVRVLEVPHWCLSYIRRAGLYCAPDPSVRLQKLAGATEEARAVTGIQWAFFGMKKSDSLNRRLMPGGYAMEALSEKTQKAYPLSLWRNAEVLRYIRQRGLPAPIAYGPGRSNGVGFGTDCLAYLERHWPGDCQRILDEFPMARAVPWGHGRKDQD